MKATFEIDDQIYAKAKAIAEQTQQSLDELVEEALETRLEKLSPSRQPAWQALPVSGSGGVWPGVDLNCFGSVMDRMDGIA